MWMLSRGLLPEVFLKIMDVETAATWLRDNLTRPERTTAIFWRNYRTSVRLLRALFEQKIRIPREMALIGFDDFDLATIISPPLTTVGQSGVDLAKRAAILLMERIQDTRATIGYVPEKMVLPATLIIRESCGKHV
jgi:LacI family transcriptional regulator